MIKIPLNKYGNLDLFLVLKKIKQKGFSRVFLECGVSLTYQFFKSNLIDVFKLFISKNNLGKAGSGSFKNTFTTFLNKKKGSVEKVNLLGDKLISYRIK